MGALPSIRDAISLLRSGRTGEAANVCEQLIRENRQDAVAWHYLGLTCLQQQDLLRAEELLEYSLALEPTEANTLNDLGLVKVRLQQYQPAVALFSRALSLNQHHADALNNLATTLNTLRRPQDALPYLERLIDLQPQSATALCDLAQTHVKLANTDTAIDTLRRAVRLAPALVRARVMLGEALESQGRFKQAHVQYLNVLRRDPDNPSALARLLQLPEAQIEPARAAKARELLQRPALAEGQRIRLNVALGHYHDRRKAHDDAFAHFRSGYDLQFARAPFNSEGYRAAVDLLIRAFTPALFLGLPRNELRSERPIFIVGMPRSGTTLMEQVLASHSRIAAGGELSTIMSIAAQFQQLQPGYEPYPTGLVSTSAADLSRMSQRYLDRIGRISSTADRVTDKQPFNFMHLGLIALLFPQGRIIHCRRHPLDTCLSCYFVSFADEFQFAGNLRTLGNYYLDYHRLMEHWRQVLPMPMLEIHYEDMVSDTEATIARVLGHCGLDWEDSCLRFHETQRAVRTPSRWQVRQPIYSGSVGRWKRYEKHLQPLTSILSPLLAEAVPN